MVRDHAFTYLHVFRFSPRPGTPAATLPPIAPPVVAERSAALRDLATTKRRHFLARQVGQTREAVIEDRNEAAPDRRLATTDNYATVNVDSDLPPGTAVEVAIDHLADDRLSARILRSLEEVTP
jgi:threonylcarbamoyladenosine tRNA methylthiotransferase MtaB